MGNLYLETKEYDLSIKMFEECKNFICRHKNRAENFWEKAF